MATPIETVGLVLAALPLLITALEHYQDGVKGYLHYTSTLEALQIRLKLEQELYQGTLKRLLLSQLTPSELDELFPEEPHHTSLWGTDYISGKLQSKLGRQYDTFMDAIQHMDATLKQLMDKLDIDMQGKPKGISDRLGWEWRRIRRSFQGREREKLLQTFEGYNGKIAKFVQNNEILAPRSTEFVKPSVAHFALIRDQACRLHSILDHSWSCSCVNPHDANLQLDERNMMPGSPSFDICFSLYPLSSQQDQKLWQMTRVCVTEMGGEVSTVAGDASQTTAIPYRTEISTLPSGDPPQTPAVPLARRPLLPKPRKAVRFSLQQEPPPLRGHTTRPGANGNQISEPLTSTRIACLCMALRNARGNPDFRGSLHDQSQRHSAIITTTTASTSLSSPTPLCLSSFLRINQRNATSPKVGKLSRQQRLGIALTLASTVLQLYKSPWLDESWGKNDIYFFFGGLDEDKRPCIGNPYVSRPFGPPAAKQIAKKPTEITANEFFGCQIINKTLFDLGIILIELCLNRPLEDLGAGMGPRHANTKPTIIDEYQVATSAIDYVYAKGGMNYGQVVQRCLKCEFGVQEGKKKLDLDTFRGLVYEGVVAPLKEDYQKYSLWRGVKV